MAGLVQTWRVPCTRGVAPGLRRARLLAARLYKPGTKPRHAILGGFWDSGAVVRRFQ